MPMNMVLQCRPGLLVVLGLHMERSYMLHIEGQVLDVILKLQNHQISFKPSLKILKRNEFTYRT
jgi:hypothetical protein